MVIGINTASSQSGRAFCADFMSRGYTIQGFSHESRRGTEFVRAVNDLDGLFLDRPQNTNQEKKQFINLGQSAVSHSLEELVDKADLIILAEPSHYFVQSVREMLPFGLKEKHTPIVLSPSRSFSTIYLWKELGDDYPIASLSTCPYSCKAPRADTAFIKRRKRNFIVSLEGSFTLAQVARLGEVFPQALFNKLPATTTLGNIGAIFHPATYLMNYPAIRQAEKDGRIFSFYMEGIAARPEVGEQLARIDHMRLSIADKLGFKVFSPGDEAAEQEWVELMQAIRAKELGVDDTNHLRKIRRDGLTELNRSITSVFHWLDYTYGVERIVGESLSEAIGRTPTYQKNSVPQWRYVEEDVATGLIPLRNLAERLGIDCSAADEMLRLADVECPQRPKENDRSLEEFSTEYLINYLTGKMFAIID